MIRIIIFTSFALLTGCRGVSNQSDIDQVQIEERQKLKAELDALELELQNDKSEKIDKLKAKKLVDKSLHFVSVYPKDSLSAGYLFRAGDVSVGLGDYQKALEFWAQVQTDYKTFDKVDMALFMQGFTCDNHLNDKEKATKYYKAFLAKYPSHQYTGQVKTLLSQLDKSPEGLIKEFQERNK